MNPVLNSSLASFSSKLPKTFSYELAINADLSSKNHITIRLLNGQVTQQSHIKTRQLLEVNIKSDGYHETLNSIKNCHLKIEQIQHLYSTFFYLGCLELSMPCNAHAQDMSILTKSPFLHCLKEGLQTIPRSHLSTYAMHTLIDNILHCICTINSFDISTVSTDDDEEESYFTYNYPFQEEAIPYFFSLFPLNFDFMTDLFLFDRFADHFVGSLKNFTHFVPLPETIQHVINEKNLKG